MTDDSQEEPRREGDAILLDTRVERLERKDAESAKREEQYKQAHLQTNKNIARFTGLLVVCSVITAAIGIWQSHISQIAANAARDAAKAASDNASIAAYALEQNEWFSTFTLGQMEEQSAAQQSAASAASDSASTAKKSMRINNRPYVSVSDADFKPPIQQGQPYIGEIESVFYNSGHSPATEVTISGIAYRDGVAFKDVGFAPIPSALIPADKGVASQYTLVIGNPDGIVNGTQKLMLKGSICYRDVFKEWHQTNYCSIYDSTRKEFMLCAGNVMDVEPPCHGK